MAKDAKDTIYIDIDDEITAVVEKIQNSPKRIIALVLPKRATVFQSIVNMKLIKRIADNENKSVVLITSEAGLLPLAGAVGLHVANTPQSRPEIPPAPKAVGTAAGNADNAELDKTATVGALAGIADNESLEIDNTEPDAGSTAGAGAAKKNPAAKAGTKKLRIPNFEKFRAKLFLAVLAVILLVGGYLLAFRILPKATVALKTDTSNLDTNLSFMADPNAQRLDKQSGVVPAIKKDFQKTDTEKAAATGEKNVGEKASGSVTMSIPCASVDGVPPTIPAGTGVSTNNLTFITKNTAQLTNPDFSGGCKFTGTSPVIAQQPGDEYNFGANKSFTVAGYSAVSATNSDSMTGGTDKMVKIISQEDIDKARDVIAKRSSEKAPAELKTEIQKAGYRPIEETLQSGTPKVTSSQNAGAEANEVTITSVNTYSMLGVKESDLNELIENDAKKHIDTSKQTILDNGLDKASLRIEQTGQGGQVTLTLQTVVVAGPELNEDTIKKEIAGRKRGDIQEMLKNRPGVNNVEVTYSPFWVQSTPKNINKITLIIEGKASGKDADK